MGGDKGGEEEESVCGEMREMRLFVDDVSDDGFKCLMGVVVDNDDVNRDGVFGVTIDGVDMSSCKCNCGLANISEVSCK